MLLSILTMLNLIIQKTKKILDSKRSTVDTKINESSGGGVNHLREVNMEDDNELKETIYDVIKTIKDPEKPATLEDLKVVHEEDIHVMKMGPCQTKIVVIEFTPTIPHCNLATLIGLCIRTKVLQTLMEPIKIDIRVKEGTHSTETEINKQVNDKERVAAAMENPDLLQIVKNCIKEPE